MMPSPLTAPLPRVAFCRSKTTRRLLTFALPFFLCLGGGKLFGQKIVQVESPNLAMTVAETDAGANSAVIFSNLGPTAADKYNSQTSASFTVAGKSAVFEPETWVAVNFIPKGDVQARVLRAAINYVSGTKLVNLGLYSDDDGKVGNPLAGGQGSTTQIPDSGECCQLAKVTLSGSGVTLTGGTRYWLVASPDNVNGATFLGSWQVSNEGSSAQFAPPSPWVTASGGWPAAEVRGTPVSGSAQPGETELDGASPRRITIFNNLGSGPEGPFYPMVGPFVAGKSADSAREGWVALPFIPRVDSHAKILAAALSYFSGDMKVNLGVYSDNDGTVGTLLPNGQGSTTDIPAYPSCCDLTEVVLPGPGVALTGKTRYWLVASTDDVNAPSFLGVWRETTVFSNYQEPQFFFWIVATSQWLAAEIRGTSP